VDFRLTSEQQELAHVAMDLARAAAPNPVVSWEDAGRFPWSFSVVLGEHGLTGINVPEVLGGQGGSLLDALVVLESVGRVAPHLADAVQATNFGAMRQIAAYGNERVVADVLRPVLAGEALATVGMSEPDAGSGLAALRTRARFDGGDVVLDGTKQFNSNGPHATHYVVWCRFGAEDHDVGAVVVPADAPGFARGKTERFMSGEAYCSLHMEECRVPADYVLLDHDGIRQMMPVFNIERLGNATRSYAFGELAFDLATRYMVERSVGGQRLTEFQGLRWRIADLRVRLDAARLLLYRAASELKEGVPDGANVSIAKCAANEVGFEAAHQALQIFGGYGFGSESMIEYLFKRTRGWMIAGGSVEVQRNRIAREIFRRIEG